MMWKGTVSCCFALSPYSSTSAKTIFLPLGPWRHGAGCPGRPRWHRTWGFQPQPRTALGSRAWPQCWACSPGAGTGISRVPSQAQQSCNPIVLVIFTFIYCSIPTFLWSLITLLWVKINLRTRLNVALLELSKWHRKNQSETHRDNKSNSCVIPASVMFLSM